MMRKKKDLPLTILKALEPFVKLKGEKFKVDTPENYLLKVVDKDEDSSFHFIIESYQKASGGSTFQFLMSRSPRNQNDNGIYNTWVEVSNLSSQFDAWINLLDEYEKVDSFFDDPILHSYYEEFFAEFEIVDEDAETNPFNTARILLIDDYLEKLEYKLDEYKTEENKNEINEIQSEIVFLRENLTTRSKKWVVDKVSKIWSKIAKNGTKFIKEFLTEAKKEIIKSVIETIKNNGIDFIS